MNILHAFDDGFPNCGDFRYEDIEIVAELQQLFGTLRDGSCTECKLLQLIAKSAYDRVGDFAALYHRLVHHTMDTSSTRVMEAQAEKLNKIENDAKFAIKSLRTLIEGCMGPVYAVAHSDHAVITVQACTSPDVLESTKGGSYSAFASAKVNQED